MYCNLLYYTVAFQRLPDQILKEYCQKEKRILPKYYNVRGSKPSEHYYCVRLEDSREKDDDFHDSQEAP